MPRQRLWIPCVQLVVLGAALLTSVVGGCGGADEETTDKPEGDGDVAAAGVGKPPEVDARDAEIRVDADGSKRYGEVPLDIWFAEPLTIAADDTAVGGGSPDGGTPGVPVAGVDPQPGPGDMEDPAPAAGGAVSWKDLIPAEVVDAELKQAANRLNQSLTSVAQYNTSYLALPPLIHSMAVMAAIAAEHPDEIRWKDDALFIRDLAGEMGAVTLMRGAKSQKALLGPHEQIGDILRGTSPGGDPPAADVQFYEFADFGELMNRLDVAFNKRLKVEISTAETLKERADFVKHEASIVAALGRVITLEGYGYADDDEFKAMAQIMIDAGRKGFEAAESGDFDAYEAAMTGIYKGCTDCHRGYRE